VRILFLLPDPFGFNWLDSQLPCFPDFDTGDCVIQHDQYAFPFHSSFPVVVLGQSMASVSVIESLLTAVDAGAFAKIISAVGTS